MSDNDSTQGASDENQGGSDDSTGSSDDGATGGTQAADQLAAELEREKTRTRSFQSDLDREKQRAAALQAELDKAKGEQSGGEPSTAGMTAEDVVRLMRAESDRTAAIGSAVEAARKDYPNADPSIFADTSKFDSGSALLEAARASHERLGDHFKSREAAIEEEVRKRYEAVHGPLPAPPSDTDQGTTTPTGDPTIEQLSSMTVDQLDALEVKNPGVIDRVLRSGDQLG